MAQLKRDFQIVSSVVLVCFVLVLVKNKIAHIERQHQIAVLVMDREESATQTIYTTQRFNKAKYHIFFLDIAGFILFILIESIKNHMKTYSKPTM